MSEVSIISPGVIQLKFDTEQLANVAALTIHKMLELISTTKQVVLRSAVKIEQGRDFATLNNLWVVSCRFYITDGPPGIMKTAPAPIEWY